MIPMNISEKIGRNLYMRDKHPLKLVKDKILAALPHDLVDFENIDPVVTVKENFDGLLVPADHPSRRPQDTFYTDESHVLRTHMTAHQIQLLGMSCGYGYEPSKKRYAGYSEGGFVAVGDVYRRDTIDRSHYPVFHQVEGAALGQSEDDLKDMLVAMIKKIFGDVPYKIVDSYFPFTEPSWEIEIQWEGQWLEVLGCGMIRKEILAAQGMPGQGWAFGMGLERLAMILYGIPDIRYFWTDDPRFLNQFARDAVKFSPYSDNPVCYKDVAFWTTEQYDYNSMCQLVREVAGDLVESVNSLDVFEKQGRVSHCYRINYRAMDRNLTNDEVNAMQDKVRSGLIDRFGVEIR